MVNRLLKLFLVFFSSINLNAQFDDAEEFLLTEDEIVDCPVDLSIQFDGNNNMHVMYLKERDDTTAYDIFYDKRDPSGIWNGATKINNDTKPVWDAALGVVEEDSLHFAWLGEGETSNELFLTTLKGVTKTERQLTNNATEEYDPTIFIDRAGYLHMAWVAFPNDTVPDAKVFYANNAFQDTLIPQRLQFSLIGDFAESANPSLVVTSTGSARVAFKGQVGNNERVQYIHNGGLNMQNWANSIITTENEFDTRVILDIDKQDQIHMAVMGFDAVDDPPRIYYTNQTPEMGNNWNDYELVDDNQLGSLTSLSVDSLGNAHLGIDEENNFIPQGNLLYANNFGGVWDVLELIEDESTFDGLIQLDNIGQGYAIAKRTNDTIVGNELIILGNPLSEITFPQIDTMVVDTMVVDTMEVDTMMSSSASTLFDTDWSVAPNPANDVLRIVFPLSSENNDWRIVDLQGKEILTGNCDYCSDQTLEVGFLNSGVYLLEVNSDNVILTEKLMIGF